MPTANELTWPDQLPPFESPDFESRLHAWLLDRLPATGFRQVVLRRHLDVLLHLVGAEIEGSIEGLRGGYATARATLGVNHPPETVAAALAAFASLGAELHRDLDFVRWVQEQRG